MSDNKKDHHQFQGKQALQRKKTTAAYSVAPPVAPPWMLMLLQGHVPFPSKQKDMGIMAGRAARPCISAVAGGTRESVMASECSHLLSETAVCEELYKAELLLCA